MRVVDETTGGMGAFVSGFRSNMSCICIQRAFTVLLLLSFLYCSFAPMKGCHISIHPRIHPSIHTHTHSQPLMHTAMSRVAVCVSDDRLFNSYLFPWPESLLALVFRHKVYITSKEWLRNMLGKIFSLSVLHVCLR